jgi:hypothetical protein
MLDEDSLPQLHSIQYRQPHNSRSTQSSPCSMGIMPAPLKGTVVCDGFWVFSVSSCLDRQYLEVLLIWPIINQDKAQFSSFGT